MGSSQHTIRKYYTEDHEAVLHVIETFSQNHRKLAENEFTAMVEMPDSQFWVCTHQEKIVGVLGYRKDPVASGIYWAEWGYVHKDYRRQGIATLLWETLEADLKLKECRKIYIDIGNESEHIDAIRLYEKRGYVQEGFCPDFWREGDDLLIFAKRIAKSGK